MFKTHEFKVGDAVLYATRSDMPASGWRTGTVLEIEGEWARVKRQKMSPYRPGFAWMRLQTLRK